MKKFFRIPGITLGVLVLLLALLVGYWYIRPNRAQVNPNLVPKTWNITNDNMHNSNTDMIEW